MDGYFENHGNMLHAEIEDGTDQRVLIDIFERYCELHLMKVIEMMGPNATFGQIVGGLMPTLIAISMKMAQDHPECFEMLMGGLGDEFRERIENTSETVWNAIQLSLAPKREMFDEIEAFLASLNNTEEE